MMLTRDMLKALDFFAEVNMADHVDVSHVNKTGGSHMLRVGVNLKSGGVIRRLMDEEGGLHPYE